MVSRLPLLSGWNLHQHKNPLVVSSIRLVTPTLDLFTWRDRASKAQSPYVEKYKWSANNLLIGEVIEEDKEWESSKASKPNNELIKSTSHRVGGRGRSYVYKKDRNGRSYRSYLDDDSSSSSSSSSRQSGYHLSQYIISEIFDFRGQDVFLDIYPHQLIKFFPPLGTSSINSIDRVPPHQELIPHIPPM